MPAKPPKQPNQSLIDGMRCLQSIISGTVPLGASEVSHALGIEVTRAHRLLRTLAHMGLLEQNANKKYTAGPAFTVLGAQAIQGSPLLREALPALERLRKETPFLVAMGVLWMRTVSFAYHGKPRSPMESAIGTQEVWPAAQSGLGMALLARQSDREIRALYRDERPAQGMTELLRELTAIRKEGHAYVATRPGHHTLAIILPSHPNVAIGLSGMIERSTLPALLSRLRQCAAKIGQEQTGKG